MACILRCWSVASDLDQSVGLSGCPSHPFLFSRPFLSPAPRSSPSSPAGGDSEWLHLTDVQTEVCRKREVEESVLTRGELESGSGVLGHKGVS